MRLLLLALEAKKEEERREMKILIADEAERDDHRAAV